MANQELKERVEQLERRWWKASVYASASAFALVLVFGLAWKDIPQRALEKAREDLSTEAVDKARKEAEESAAHAVTSARAAEEAQRRASEAAEATHRLPSRVDALEQD